jgi:hypothetical protein
VLVLHRLVISGTPPVRIAHGSHATTVAASRPAQGEADDPAPYRWD